MQLLPMNIPAEIHAVGLGGADAAIARGPLVIMAHGLLSIAADRRNAFVVRSALGDFDAAQAAAALQWWGAPAARQD